MIPKQSIIMPYHRNKDMLFYTLSLMDKILPSDVEIIVVGNNSSQEELNFDLPTRFRFIKIARSLLYSKAVNLGVQEASGEIITLCDQDIFGYQNWYTPMLKLLLSNNQIGAVSSKMLNPTNDRIIECGLMYTKTRILHPLRGVRSNHHWATFDREVSTSTSATMMMRKSVYTALNGMDEDMPYCCSDCDMGFKVREIGLQNWICSSSIVYHRGSSSIKNGKRMSFSHLLTDSQHMFFAKNYGRLQPDIQKWMNYTLTDFSEHHSIASAYHFVNLSSFGEYEWYADYTKSYLKTTYYDIHSFPQKERDIISLQLYDELPYSYMNITAPIIYFVDLFLSLKDNAIWSKMRDINHDLVVDSHGNIFPLSDIILNHC